MKISLGWLSDFVDLSGLGPEEIAERITVHTAEVDEVERLEPLPKGVVAGKVVQTTPIAEGSFVPVLAEVDVGGGRVAIVCGAPNVHVGMVTAVALPGAVIAGGHPVRPETKHGHRSEAVMCSPAEINLGPVADSLVELPADIRPGTELATLLPSGDILVTVDNKSLTHRPDLWGQYGFAREFAAIFRRDLKPLAQVALSEHEGKPELDLRVDAPEDCPFYGALRFQVEKSGISPLWMQQRLYAVGSRPRSLLVDVTNYVQFELGQPTHAFDGDKVERIVVARSGSPRQFKTLDAEIRDLRPEDLLIFGGSEPVAIAGVMGGYGSEISNSTRRILLESANFKGSRVRTTSVRLGLRTDASLRFEKKLPPVFAPMAVGRILKLLELTNLKYAVTSRFSAVGDVQDHFRPIQLPKGYFSRRAGAEISDDTAIGLLEAIGFRTRRRDNGGIEASAPSFRSTFDISNAEDVSEEVMRLFGYDRIEPRLPMARIDSAPLHALSRNHHRARRLLAEAHGFIEVQTYGWFVEPWLAEIGYRPSRTTLDLANPVANDRRSMREALLPNLLAVANENRRNFEKFSIFELGKVFWIDADGVKQEANELCGLLVDQRSTANQGRLFASARAALDDVLKGAGLQPLEARKASVGDASPIWERTEASVDLLLAGRPIGKMGIIPKSLRQRIIDAGSAAWFSVEIDELAGPVYPSIPYKALLPYPGSLQDFTFTWPRARGYAELDGILSGFCSAMLVERNFVDVYTPEERDTANYTFRFRIHWPDRTPSSEDIQRFRDDLLKHARAHGVELV